MTDAAELHRDALVFDAHVDTLSRMWDRPRDSWGMPLHDQTPVDDFGLVDDTGEPVTHLSIERLRAGGVDVQVAALFVVSRVVHPESAKRVLTLMDIARRVVAAHPDDLCVATTGEEMRAARRDGRTALVFSIENGCALEGSLSMLRTFHALGLRALGIQWNGRNDLGSGVGPGSDDTGLTEFGRRAVAECGRLGIVVDVSHANQATFHDVARQVDGPFIASHSNARALCDHPRNLTDEQLDVLAEHDGVVGLVFNPPFLREGGNDGPHGPTVLADVVSHARHIADRIGPEHLGLGSDFDGIESVPEGLEHPGCLPHLTAALLDAGFDPPEVRGILGANFVRAWEAVIG